MIYVGCIVSSQIGENALLTLMLLSNDSVSVHSSFGIIKRAPVTSWSTLRSGLVRRLGAWHYVGQGRPWRLRHHAYRQVCRRESGELWLQGRMLASIGARRDVSGPTACLNVVGACIGVVGLQSCGAIRFSAPADSSTLTFQARL